MEVTDTEVHLINTIFEFGLSLEQTGYEYCVHYHFEGDVIVLATEDYEERVYDLEEAKEVLSDWADEFGTSSKEAAPIATFAEQLAIFVEPTSANPYEALFLQDIWGLAEQHGMTPHKELWVGEELLFAQDDILGFFEDTNGVYWSVFLDEGDVMYEEVDFSEVF